MKDKGQKMEKYIFTFGSNQLPELSYKVRPMELMLVIEAEDEYTARREVFESFIGERFCTSYPYEKYAEEFAEEYGMYEITLDVLNKMKDEK